MRSKNHVSLIGNVGGDPELRSTRTGQTVAHFSLATSVKFTNDAGNQEERTEWHRVVAWGKVAALVEKYVKKGDRLAIDGHLRYGSYAKPCAHCSTELTAYTTEIVVRELYLIDGGGAR